MSKPLPKSLHTITAIVNIALHLHTQTEGEQPLAEYISEALKILGYDDAATIHQFGHATIDPYGLAYASLTKFRKAVEQ